MNHMHRYEQMDDWDPVSTLAPFSSLFVITQVCNATKCLGRAAPKQQLFAYFTYFPPHEGSIATLSPGQEYTAGHSGLTGFTGDHGFSSPH